MKPNAWIVGSCIGLVGWTMVAARGEVDAPKLFAARGYDFEKAASSWRLLEERYRRVAGKVRFQRYLPARDKPHETQLHFSIDGTQAELQEVYGRADAKRIMAVLVANGHSYITRKKGSRWFLYWTAKDPTRGLDQVRMRLNFLRLPSHFLALRLDEFLASPELASLKLRECNKTPDRKQHGRDSATKGRVTLKTRKPPESGHRYVELLFRWNGIRKGQSRKSVITGTLKVDPAREWRIVGWDTSTFREDGLARRSVVQLDYRDGDGTRSNLHRVTVLVSWQTGSKKRGEMMGDATAAGAAAELACDDEHYNQKQVYTVEELAFLKKGDTSVDLRRYGLVDMKRADDAGGSESNGEDVHTNRSSVGLAARGLSSWSRFQVALGAIVVLCLLSVVTSWIRSRRRKVTEVVSRLMVFALGMASVVDGRQASADSGDGPLWKTLPDRAVVFIEIRNTQQLGKSLAETTYGRALAIPEVSRIVRQVVASLEKQYLFPYREFLCLPSWAILKERPLHYCYAVVDVPGSGFAFLGLYRTADERSASELIQELCEAHRRTGGTVKASGSGASRTFRFQTTGYGWPRTVARYGRLVVQSTSSELLSHFHPPRDTTRTSDNVLVQWVDRHVPGRGKAMSPLVAFVDLESLSNRSPVVGSLAKVFLGPQQGGIEAVLVAVDFPQSPFSFRIRGRIRLVAANDRGLGIVQFGMGAVRPGHWIPATVASCAVLRINPNKTLDRIIEHYDSLQGEGAFIGGPAARMDKRLALGDIRKLADMFTGRVVAATWYSQPPKANGKCRLIGLELADPVAMQRMLDRCAKGRDAGLRRRSYLNVAYYETKQPFRVYVSGKTIVRLEPVSLKDSPALRPVANCFAILGRELVYADDVAATKQVIRTSAGKAESLRDSPVYKLVSTLARRESHRDIVLLSYGDPAPYWENLYALLDDGILAREARGIRSASVDSSLLTQALESGIRVPFHKIASQLAPYGVVVSIERRDIAWTVVGLAKQP